MPKEHPAKETLRRELTGEASPKLLLTMLETRGEAALGIVAADAMGIEGECSPGVVLNLKPSTLSKQVSRILPHETSIEIVAKAGAYVGKYVECLPNSLGLTPHGIKTLSHSRHESRLIPALLLFCCFVPSELAAEIRYRKANILRYLASRLIRRDRPFELQRGCLALLKEAVIREKDAGVGTTMVHTLNRADATGIRDVDRLEVVGRHAKFVRPIQTPLEYLPDVPAPLPEASRMAPRSKEIEDLLGVLHNANRMSRGAAAHMTTPHIPEDHDVTRFLFEYIGAIQRGLDEFPAIHRESLYQLQAINTCLERGNPGALREALTTPKVRETLHESICEVLQIRDEADPRPKFSSLALTLTERIGRFTTKCL